jgi:DNA-binding NarL/FixJ family response regulator
MIRVLIADDQALFREGLKTVLSARGCDVVGEAAQGEEAVSLAVELSPDVVLMDLRMPVLDGVEATRRIRQLNPAPAVIALTTFDDDDSVFDSMRAGAIGYLLKDAEPAQLVEAIHLAAQGKSLLQPSIASKLVREFARLAPARPRDLASELGLSSREIEVLQELVRGASNKEIAIALNIAEGTVKNHITHIFVKLKVQDRFQAALRVKMLGYPLPGKAP